VNYATNTNKEHWRKTVRWTRQPLVVAAHYRSALNGVHAKDGSQMFNKSWRFGASRFYLGGRPPRRSAINSSTSDVPGLACSLTSRRACSSRRLRLVIRNSSWSIRNISSSPALIPSSLRIEAGITKRPSASIRARVAFFIVGLSIRCGCCNTLSTL